MWSGMQSGRGGGWNSAGAWLSGGTLNALAYVSSTHLETVILTSRMVVTPCVCIPPVRLAVMSRLLTRYICDIECLLSVCTCVDLLLQQKKVIDCQNTEQQNLCSNRFPKWPNGTRCWTQCRNITRSGIITPDSQRY